MEGAPVTSSAYKAVIIGAGPAGLTAAYDLSKKGQRVVVLEADSRYVGGLSRTVEYHGYRFDIGGHRFFSKSQEVEDLWTEILGPDLLVRPRSSKIFYGGKFYAYPLKPLEALWQLGVMESALCVLSFLKARLKPVRDPKSFEDWVVNEFGERLFRIFFKTYTEKVWGMSCKEISADWAAQRIRGLTLAGAIRNALLPKRKPDDRSQTVKTLIDTFRYPRLGPGMMWETCAEKVRALGGEILLGRSVTACRFDAASSEWKVTARTVDGAMEESRGKHVVSSMPMRQLVSQVEPRLPGNALRSGNSLRYRDFLTIGLILRERNRITDNWVYIHDPSVKMGRVQNYKAWSPEMVPDPDFCCYGLEYFCFENDGLWTMNDAELIALGTRELEQVGLCKAADVVDGCVMRQPKAYPVYDGDYQRHVSVVRQTLDAHCPNLHLVGRNGMHRYNNQDHAMLTALLAARNILAGENKYDVWSVNEDGVYHESGRTRERPRNGLECAIDKSGSEQGEVVG
jgi:protoporphyrinogen oxidase